jgi:hypothetical protein
MRYRYNFFFEFDVEFDIEFDIGFFGSAGGSGNGWTRPEHCRQIAGSRTPEGTGPGIGCL